MADSSQKSWQGNPNAPKIPSLVYSNEKADLAGMFTCAVSYGIVIILFFQCMSALLNPVIRTRGIKWLLVAHTVAIFLFVTAFTAINLNGLSISYIDNRASPGGGELPPGPLGYQYITYSMTSGSVSTLMFLLNNLLADGLLLYRCYAMYASSPWVIVLPCLLYLATVAMGIVLVYYQIAKPSCTIWSSATAINVGVPYSISVSLDVLLTLMIAVRLVLLSRDIRSAMGVPFRLSGTYKAVITILSESSALYAITFLLWIGTWAAESPAEYFFFPVLAQTQVIAPFLIVLQVVHRRASTDDLVSGDICSIPLSQGESTGIGGHPAGSTSTGEDWKVSRWARG